MDMTEISKVGDRKRISDKSKQLGEKISKLSADVIKLNVSQDTAYWDLRQKLQQVEGNHERLQQNMVEVQMQYETISGQYQEELRQRPETLNKLNSTREICDVLEDYSERLKQTLSRCKADQASLCEAYRGSGQAVLDLKTAHLQADERNRQLVASLEDKVKLSEEHQKRLMELFSASKQQFESELTAAREQLCAAQAGNEQLRTALTDVNSNLSVANSQLEKKEETIMSLKHEMKQLIQEFNAQIEGARNTLETQEKNLKQATEANMELKKALTHQEQFSKTMADQNSALDDKIAALEEEKAKATEYIEKLKNQLEEAYYFNGNAKKEISSLMEESEKLKEVLKEREELIGNLKLEVDTLHDRISMIEQSNRNMVEELNKTVEERDQYCERVQQLVGKTETLQGKMDEIENRAKNYRESTDEMIQDLTKTIEDQKKEMDLKASTAAQLMSELKSSTDTQNKLQGALQRSRKELEEEKDHAKEMEVKLGIRIEHLEGIVKDKENELSKQMSVILEMRNEKDRLLEKISGMQGTIDNIQKELTGRPEAREPPALAERPEPDDNAVMMTPITQDREMSPVFKPSSKIAIPRSAPKQSLEQRNQQLKQQQKESIYSLFSDSSTDGNTLDAEEVNRRFSALSRGERVPPLPLSSLKRRKVADREVAHDKPVRNETQVLQFPSPSLSQAKADLANKNRIFFKNKRFQTKSKKN